MNIFGSSTIMTSIFLAPEMPVLTTEPSGTRQLHHYMTRHDRPMVYAWMHEMTESMEITNKIV